MAPFMFTGNLAMKSGPAHEANRSVADSVPCLGITTEVGFLSGGFSQLTSIATFARMNSFAAFSVTDSPDSTMARISIASLHQL